MQKLFQNKISFKTPHNCNIEAFILTYNRKDFLKDSINSLLMQSIGDIDITIMDNGSVDGTEEFVKSLQKEHPNIYYHKRIYNDPFENMNDAVNLAKKDYMMLFHDDDILHPDYIKLACEAINKYKNIGIISCDYKEYTNPNCQNWKKIPKTFYHITSKNDLADFLYYKRKFVFSPVIYKTANLKQYMKNQQKELFEYKLMGKMCDKSIVLDTMQNNDEAIIFKSRFLLRYRIHLGQDTKTSGPYYNQIIEFNKFYKNYMERTKYSKFLFNLINYKQLKYAYIWGKDNTLSLKQFIQKALDEGAGCFYTKLCISKFGSLFIGLAHVLRKVFECRYLKESL